MKKAIIVGSGGQDGKLLYDLLANTGYEKIIGLDEGSIQSYGTNLKNPVDISHKDEVCRLVEVVKPDEIYYLAAFHHSSQDLPPEDIALFTQSHNVQSLGFMHFLEAIRNQQPDTRIFYAASAHIFGDASGDIQDENTPLNPVSIYGITKTEGLLIGRYYRREYGLFVAHGILYNHESCYRKDSFVSRKIIAGAVAIKKGLAQDKILLGNLSAEVDWGYAPDYVEAMRRILGLDAPGDYVIATGIKHTVWDFARIAFEYLGLDGKLYVAEDKSILKRKSNLLVGNPAKLMKLTGWRPSVNFREMIRLLLIQEGAELHDK